MGAVFSGLLFDTNDNDVIINYSPLPGLLESGCHPSLMKPSGTMNLGRIITHLPCVSPAMCSCVSGTVRV